MRTFIGLFLLSLLFACADLEQSEQLNRINQLGKKVDSLLIVLNQVNDPQLADEIKLNTSLLSDFTLLAISDTIMEADARLIDNYANYIKLLSSLKVQLEKIYVFLDEQNEAIQKLKKDIGNGYGRRDTYNNNISFEQKKSKLIEGKLNEMKTKKIKTLLNIAFLNLKTRELIQKLQLTQSKS
jgi:hypothetical protein